jgi:Family of unknown function (DUF6882)
MDFVEWQKKQDSFLEFLKKHGADEAPYRVDLEKRKIYWVNKAGLSLVVADCRVLLSYALSNKSVMMGWANVSLADGSFIEPIEGMEDIYPDCAPEHVWQLAMRAAEGARAEAIYRTPSPQSWVLLGIWNLRPGGAEQFTSGSPQNHVLKVLQSLVSHDDFEERQVLMDNYAESFLQMANHPYKGTHFEKRLKDVARGLRNSLVVEDEAMQSEALGQLCEDWERDRSESV